MEREIKFRGRSILSNQFVYGYFYEMYHKSSDSLMLLPYIISSAPKSPPLYVKRDTIGQFTGLLDKKGVEIYEGDIFHLGDKIILHVVEWIDSGFKGRQISNKSTVGLEYWQDRIEIIGNIHDNPQLLNK
jgi:uncharacterized phage protein (TIGR01671 family)